jgi:hypothetical protein
MQDVINSEKDEACPTVQTPKANPIRFFFFFGTSMFTTGTSALSFLRATRKFGVLFVGASKIDYIR